MMVNKLLYITLCPVLLWMLSGPPSTGYCRDTGFKYISNYDSKTYKRQPRNYCVLEDKRGIIYVGNNNDLLEFDGVSWRIIDVQNDNVRSMAMDENGTIHIGGKNEFGYLEPDSKGTLQYRSLLTFMKNKDKDVENVWQTHSTKEGIYFRASKHLFRWDPGSRRINTFYPSKNFKYSFVFDGKYFIQDEIDGLLHMKNDSLIPVPGGEILKSEKIFMTAPYDPGHRVLIGTRGKGFFIYDGNTIRPFPMEADKYLEGKQLSQGIRLSSGDFALTTLEGGLVIVNPQGEIKEIFNRASGLQNDSVRHVFQDSGGNLWLALDKGISKIEYVSPFSFYDDRSDLPGNVLSVIRHNNLLYAGTTRGLFVRDAGNRFRPVGGISGNCYALLSIDGSLLAAATNGVFQAGYTDRIINDPSYTLVQSHLEKNRIWAGTRNGPVSLKRNTETGRWVEEHRFKNITWEIRTIVEDPQGNLWLGTGTKGTIHVDFSSGGTMINPSISTYNESDGLPPGAVRVFWAADHPVFATDNGIYRFDKSTKTFIPDSTLGKEFTGGQNGSRGVFRIVEDKKNSLWIHSDSRNFRAVPREGGTFTLNRTPFLRLSDTQVNAIYPDGEITWFAGNDGLIRYEPTIKKDYRRDFQVLIRNVQINGKPVFDGYITANTKDFIIKVEYEDRKNFHFEIAAPFFEAENSNRFRYFLDGLDDHWSGWHSGNSTDFTILDSGTYTFQAQAKNVYGHTGREAAFQFKILPPWYGTWWAFTVYAAAAFFMVFLIVKWRSGKLEKEKQKLEQIVKDRTAELEEKSEKLREMDKVKSRFFANISHEFRTPLTLIMGPLEQLLSGDGDSKAGGQEQQKEFNLMYRNSRRLLSLINQLLELSKFDSGKMKLNASRQNIVPLLKGIVTSFESIAAKNKQTLVFQAETGNIAPDVDSQKLEEAVVNLLSNAVKFTPPGGKIVVKVFCHPPDEKNFPSGSVGISVGDTGPGIPRDQLAHIFDRFYQANRIHSSHQKGTGIGLAIAKEVVELHRGQIDVHSREGKNSGTEFIIKLPGPGPGVPADDKGVPADDSVELSDNSNNETFFGGSRGAVFQKSPPVFHGDEGKKNLTPTTMPTTAENVILVVEDNPDVRDFIRGSLEPDYHVEEAIDGREGMKKARELIPDLIISDIMMPEVDGYELCRVLKKDIKTSHVPIILLTAKASEESVIEGLETGADDYITKPFNTKILNTRVKNLIDLRRRLQEKIQRENMLQPTDIAVSSMDQTFIKELRDTIEKHLSDSLFNVEQLGKKLYMSRASLYRKVLALTGESPRDFIKSCRLKRGAQLLKANFGNVTEVAFEVGFSSTAYFTRCFKEKFHQLPRTFQEVSKESA